MKVSLNIMERQLLPTLFGKSDAMSYELGRIITKKLELREKEAEEFYAETPLLDKEGKPVLNKEGKPIMKKEINILPDGRISWSEKAINHLKTFEFGTPSGLHPLSQKTISWIKHFFNITKKDLKWKN